MRNHWLRITRELSSLAVLLLLAACGGGEGGGGAPVDASKGGVASGAVPHGGAAPGAGPRSPLPPHVPNEVIVRFRDGVAELTKTTALSRVAGTRVRTFRIL